MSSCARYSLGFLALDGIVETPNSKGPSNPGKSFTVERTLRFFPSEAYMARTAMSERGLVYTDEDLQHRMLVLS